MSFSHSVPRRSRPTPSLRGDYSFYSHSFKAKGPHQALSLRNDDKARIRERNHLSFCREKLRFLGAQMICAEDGQQLAVVVPVPASPSRGLPPKFTHGQRMSICMKHFDWSPWNGVVSTRYGDHTLLDSAQARASPRSSNTIVMQSVKP